MKKNRIISALLCLSLAAGLLIPGLPAYAEGEGESGSNSGMKLSKTAKANGDGTYTITLEAYATGEKVISQVNKDVPTDIVLVLDQSGSMDENMSSAQAYAPYENQSNSSLRRHRFNGGDKNLYYPLGDGYVQVSVDRVTVQDYTKISAETTNSEYYYEYYYYDNLYIKDEDGNYQQVTVSRDYTYNGYQYTYKVNNQTILVSTGRNTVPDFNGYGPLYQFGDFYKYTYYYQLPGEDRVVIETSTGDNTVPNETFYRYGTVNTSRLQALTTAVTTFANSVATKAAGADGEIGTEDDINHRVAVVGYASRKDSNNPWINTELFIGATQHNYNVDASSYYNQAFQNMNTQAGQDNIAASIGALDANGATYTNYGLEMANGILDAYELQPNEKRNRVIVLFTDGYPGKNADDFNQTAADDALAEATTAKNAGVSVYSVGIFSGADASSPGNKDGTNTQAANWFMQQVSSNNGTPRTPSYYLSAADAGTLNSIFEQIADNIETGGTTTTLGESAVIKDIISPQFQLPADATADDITLETWHCTGKTGDAYTWSKNKDAMGAKASVDGDKVNVTGFDFAGNYVGTVTDKGNVTYRGNKLVISFTVSPKPGFLGGNNVYTNTSAGVYENKDAPDPVLVFNRPQVNVPIKDVTVDAADKDVYLLSEVKLDALKNDATVKVGDVELNLSEENYGLQTWQNEYVDITVKITDANGTEVTTPLSQLKDDTTYTITVTVTPKSNGEGASGTVATEKSGNDKADINVYKPELTYKDSEVFYGETKPTDAELADNLSLTQWKHNGTEATADMGTAPDLAITYTPNASQIDDNNKINSTQDIPVAAVVKIGNEDVTTYTTFVHTPCDPACGWSEPGQKGSPAFLLHVKTASLIINKTGADGNKNEGFIFDVTGPNNLTFRVSVKDNGTVKITGLPLGTYTVEEDTNWSWRYKAQNQGSAELTKDKPEGTVTIKNAKDNYYLLDGNAYKQNNSVQYAAN